MSIKDSLKDRFPTLIRTLAIFRTSWREQDKRDASPKPQTDYEFLPAALEIIEKPASPGLRWLLLILCSLFALALLWSFIGRIDIVAVATGKTVPAGNAKVIQPIEIGSVRAIHVRNGDYVRKGQLLIELDPTLASADEAQSNQALMSAQLVQARNDAILAHLAGRSARFVPPSGTPADVAATEAQYVRTAIAEYEAEAAGIRQQKAEKASELVAAQAEVAKLKETLPYLDKQMDARRKLADAGHFSRLKLLEYEQARVEHMRNIDIQQANAARARASMRELDARLNQLKQGFGKGAVTSLSEANDKAGMASEELRKSGRHRELLKIRSPVDGVVQQLSVATIGGVVQPAQPLMTVVPCSTDGPRSTNLASCSSAVEVEAHIQNKDIGFVHVGQRVAVKLEAFNFTDYGLLDAHVASISRDAIDMAAPNGQDSSESRPAQGLVYAVRIILDCGAPTRQSLCDRVGPGMAVQAEIKTGKRRIIDYLLSPISKAADEAGRER